MSAGSADDRAAFDEIFARVRPELDALIALYPEKRSALLPMIHRLQEEQGFVSREAMEAVAQLCDITLAAVESTVSFYTLFYRKPIGKYMLQPCRNLSCLLGGAQEIMDYFRAQLGIGHLETTADGTFSYEEVECLAACDRAPCMQVNLDFVYDLTKEKIDAMIAQMRAGSYVTPPLPQTKQPERTWTIPKEAPRKAPGARGVPNPNDPGGIGDATGLIVLDRFAREEPTLSARSRERLVRDSVAAAELFEEPRENGSGHR